MHGEESSAALSPKTMMSRFAILLLVSIGVGAAGGATVLEAHQATAVGVFLAIIMGTLFFWGFRLAIAFLGLAVLICTNSLSIAQFVQSSALEVILFLVGMMIVVGALRDLDYGIYPYTTSSNSIAAYAPVGSGLPTAKIDEVVGVVKAYSSCVGEGPFVCEWFGEEAEQLRDAGDEYGAKTGRPRRVGPIDLVATRYGVQMQGATNIALTKLDVLSYMEKIPLCAHYELSGEQTDEFPFPVLQQDAKPVVEYMDGWQCDISGARSWEELPEAARRYVEYVEQAIGCHIGYVSVGPERDSLIIR